MIQFGHAISTDLDESNEITTTESYLLFLHDCELPATVLVTSSVMYTMMLIGLHAGFYRRQAHATTPASPRKLNL
jgi:fatty-acid desaturase